MHSKANQPPTSKKTSSSTKLVYIGRVSQGLRGINQFFRTYWHKLVKFEEPNREQSILEMQEFLVPKRQELANARALLERIHWLSTKDFKAASALQQELEQQTTLVETLKQDVITLENKISDAKFQKDLLELQELINQANLPLLKLEACWQQCQTLTSAQTAVKLELLKMQLVEMQSSLSELRGVVAQIIAAQKRTQSQYEQMHSKGYEERAKLLLMIIKQLTISKETQEQQLLTWDTRISQLNSELNIKKHILSIQAERARDN